MGQRIATCLPERMALNAALKATSVLPKPTSPHNNRSIGRGDSISCLISCHALSWSSVKSYSNELSKSFWNSSSSLKANPLTWLLSLYKFNRRSAKRLTLSLIFFFVFSQSLLCNLDNLGEAPSLPRYFLTSWNWERGTYNISPP